MAASHDLYALIGTLSKTEKRYCRMMLESGAGRRAESCLRLFEILSAMSEPDEAALRAAVEREPFAGHLAVTKHNLYEHLLRSLRTFSAVRDPRARIRGLIDDAEVLLLRGLRKQAHDRLRHAREQAERYGDLPEQLTIVRLEWMIDAHNGYAGVDPEQFRQRRARVQSILNDVSNYWDYLDAFAGVSHELLHRGPGIDKEKSGQNVLENLQALAPPSSPRALHLQLETLRQYHMLTARYAEGYEHSVRYLQFVESYPMSERLEHLNYISALYNHVMVSVRTGRYDEARDTFEKLCALELHGRFARTRQAHLRFCCRLELLMVDLDHEAIAALADELEEVCDADRNGFARQIRIGYAVDLAYAQFANGLLREAARTLHPVINDYRPGFRNDVLCTARLFQMMIHYDLGDLELLPYLIRSTYRFIARCRGLSGVDRVVLRFLRRLPNVVTPAGLIAEFARARRELTAISDPAEREASASAAILCWLDARITGRPFGELAREARRAVVKTVDAVASVEVEALMTD